MHQQVQRVDERRPTPMKRRSDDGIAKSVKEILARNVPSICVGVVGCLCVALPIAFKVAGVAYWPLVIAYGGCLVGIALSGAIE